MTDDSTDSTHDAPDTLQAPRTWTMWAGQRLNHGDTEPVFCDIDEHRMYTRMHGHDNPIAVTAVEDPDGSYWGWLTNENPDRNADPVYATYPTMIHEHEGIFNVCFPYGYQAEVEVRAGRVVRMSVTAAVPTP